jgi:hypothetical protein
MRLGNLEAHHFFLLETVLNSRISVLLEYWSENELESFWDFGFVNIVQDLDV